MLSSAVEEAARHLTRWSGSGMSWHADLEWVSSDDAENAAGDRLPVTWRGRLEEGAARSIAGSQAVRQQRRWARSAGVGVMPCHRSAQDVSAALAMAQLDGPLEAILLLYACEDFAKWPVVERHLMGVLLHPHSREAAQDAMARLMYRRPAMPLDKRAKMLRCRKADYGRVRTAATALLGSWLNTSARRFLRHLA